MMEELRCLKTYGISDEETKCIDVNIGVSAVGSLSDVQVKESGGSACMSLPSTQALHNRFIIWRSSQCSLDLEEHSLDESISSRLRLNFEHARVLPGTHIGRGSIDWQLLVCTTVAVHRIILRPGLDSGLLDSLTTQVCTHPSTWTLCESQPAMPYISACHLRANDEALFAVGYADGSIHLLCMPHIHTPPEGVVRSVLQSQWSARRLLSGLVGRMYQEDANKGPSSILFLPQHSKCLLAAVFPDATIRMWDTAKNRQVISTNLLSYVSGELIQQQTQGSDIIMRQVHGGSKCHIVCYLPINGASKIIILKVHDAKGTTQLSKLMQIESDQCRLVDLSAVSDTLYAVWLHETNTSIVNKISINLHDVSHGDWNEVGQPAMPTFPSCPSEFDTTDGIDSFYINWLVESLTFHVNYICRAIQVICHVQPVVNCGDNPRAVISELRRALTVYHKKESGREQQMEDTEEMRDSTIQMWQAVFSSCVQYLHAGSTPLSLLSCPNISMYGVIRTEHWGVFVEECGISSMLNIAWSSAPNLGCHIWLQCCVNLTQYISQPLQHQLQTISLNSFQHISHVLPGVDDNELRGRMLGAVDEMASYLRMLIAYLDAQIIVDSDVKRHLSQIELVEGVKSGLSIELLSTGLRTCITSRLRMCIASMHLVTLCVQWFQICTGGELDELCCELIKLTNNYSCLARLIGDSPEIITSYLDTRRPCGRMVRALMVYKMDDDSVKSDWGGMSGPLISTALSTMWPNCTLLTLLQHLMHINAPKLLISYVNSLQPWPENLENSLNHFLGWAYIEIGEFDTAYETLLSACKGVSARDNIFLDSVFDDVTNASQPISPADYYLKIGALFEEKGERSMLIKVIEHGLSQSNKQQDARLWSVLFRTHLHLGNYEAALICVQANNDSVSQENCLRELFNNMAQEGRASLLASLNFGCLRRQVMRLMEKRASCAQLDDQSAYPLLHALHVNANDFKRAAQSMYDWFCRLRAESNSPDSIQLQVRALSVCACDLGLVDSKQAWVIRPCNDSNSTKRDNQGDTKSHSNVTIITEKQVRAHLTIQKARLTLTKIHKSQRYLPPVTPPELVSALVDECLFDMAAIISIEAGLSLQKIVHALTTQCVHASNRKDQPDINFIHMNQATVTSSSANSTTSQCWNLLKCFINAYSSASSTRECRMLAWALERMLQLQYALPGWICMRLQETDISEYMRLLCMYGHVNMAVDTCVQYLQALLDSHDSNRFGLNDIIRPGSRGVWVPYTAIDDLLHCLQEDTLHLAAKERKKEELDCMLQKYFSALSTACIV